MISTQLTHCNRHIGMVLSWDIGNCYKDKEAGKQEEIIKIVAEISCQLSLFNCLQQFRIDPNWIDHHQITIYLKILKSGTNIYYTFITYVSTILSFTLYNWTEECSNCTK